jgi:dTDP-4-amino-4,6-dideoxygalactose transaminase
MIPLFKVFCKENIHEDLAPIFQSGYIGQGPQVDKFEAKLREFFDADYVITTNSGTSAEQLGLQLLDLQHGDEVLTTPLTCLHYSNYVKLADGSSKQIGEIVNKKLDVDVLSLDIITGQLVKSRIVNWIKLPIGDKQWYRIYHKWSGNCKGGQYGVTLTNDHQVLTNRGYVRVDQLDNTYKVATKERQLNNLQKAFVLGCMLGDGHIDKRVKRSRFTTSHTERNEDYIRIKQKALLDFNASVCYENREFVKRGEPIFQLYTRGCAEFGKLRERFYNGKKKILPKDLFYGEFSPITLATWFMDDGTKLPHNALILCTHGFTKGENQLLIDILKQRFDIDANLQYDNRGRGYCRVYIGVKNDAANKFFSIVAPYILESFRYKLPKKFRDNYKFDDNLWNLGQTEIFFDDIIVKKLEELPNYYPKLMYCIDVENTHNFISSGIVLKNCTATNWPLLTHKLNIKWIDVNCTTLNIDLDDLQRKLSEKTKLIVFVHWGGCPINYDKLEKVLQDHQSLFGKRPFVIEDCAHSFGSTWDDYQLAGIQNGSLKFYSFQAIKHLTCGDGGALIVPKQEMYRRGRLLRWYGISRDDNKRDLRCEANIPEHGLKLHLNDINATIGLSNMEHIVEILDAHRQNAKCYDTEFTEISGVTPQAVPKKANPSYWLYTLLVENKSDFMKWMKECQIMVSRVHERNDQHSCVQEFRVQLPSLDWVCDRMVCIPVGWWVTPENREYIVDCIKKGW